MLTIPGRRSVASWVAVAMVASGVALVAAPAQASGFPTSGSSGSYENNDYVVSYDANSGSGTPASRYATWNTNVTLHDGNGVSREGYSLDAWTTGKDGSGSRYNPGTSIRMPSHGVSLYAHWKVNQYAVSFDANEGAGSETAVTADFGSSVPLARGSSFSRDGYSLDGWTESGDGSGTHYGLSDSLQVPSHGVKLYAHWKANKYGVHYDANEGDGLEQDQAADYGTQVPVANGDSVTREGYTLDEWSTGKDGSGTHYRRGDSLQIPSHVVTLYAHWRINQYAVTFDANDGTGTEAGETADFSSTVPLAKGDHVSRQGWTLDSWNTERDGSGTRYGLGDGYRVPSRHTHLYAHWTINKYKVWYESNDGHGTQGEQSEDYDHDFTLGHGGYARACYTQDGWNTEADGSGHRYGMDDPVRMPYGGMRLYAHWTENTYAVNYDANTGRGTEDEVAAQYGSAVQVGYGSNLERDGYTLDGWTENADGSGQFYGLGDEVRMPCRGIHLHGHWRINQYAVTYDNNGGTGSEPSQTRDYASELTLSLGAEMSRTGYTLVGWNTDEDGDGTAYGLGATVTIPCHHVRLYAQWVANDYTVAYRANGADSGDVPADQTFTVENPTSIVDNTGGLARSGYLFTGWATSADGAVAYTSGQQYGEAQDLTLYAVWLAADFAVIYHANGATAGNVPDAATFTVESPAVVADNTNSLVRDGYRFLGWSATTDGSVDYAPGASYGTPVTLDLYAVWTALPVVIPPSSATTKYLTSRTTRPLASVPPPAGQTWNLGTMRLVNPANHARATKVVVKQGTWTLLLATGAVTFAPRSGFVGTVRIGFEVTSSGGLLSSSTVTMVVLPARTMVRSATVYFAPMSAVLSPQAKATLKALATSVKKAGKPLSSVTTGYVQATSSSANDRSLSLARARTIAAYLTALGLPHAKSALGLGKASDKGWKARRATATVTFLIS